MNIIIAGVGDVGSHLAKMLSKQKHAITVIGDDKERLELLNNQLDVLTYYASSTSVGALRDAGVGSCDLFIAVNHEEDPNITSALLAKKLGAAQTIARVNNSEYLEESNQNFLNSIGIDSVIYPERLAAEEIVDSLKLSGIRQTSNISDGRLQLLSIKIRENALPLGQTLNEMGQQFDAEHFRIVALKRQGHTIIPRGQDRIVLGDMVHVLVEPDYVNHIFHIFGKTQQEIRNVMIIGGTRIGVKAASLLEKNYSVKLIEEDRDRCEECAAKLMNTLIINGDGRDISLLKEEGVQQMDALVSVSESSENNILTSLLGKQLGINKSVSLIENLDYLDLAENLGLGSVVNTKIIAAAHIYRHTMNVNIAHLKFLTYSEAEVFEIVAEPKSKITKRPLSQTPFPPNATIGGLVRNNEVIIAKGTIQIAAGDNVVIFALPEAVNAVIKLFQA